MVPAGDLSELRGNCRKSEKSEVNKTDQQKMGRKTQG